MPYQYQADTYKTINGVKYRVYWVNYTNGGGGSTQMMEPMPGFISVPQTENYRSNPERSYPANNWTAIYADGNRLTYQFTSGLAPFSTVNSIGNNYSSLTPPTITSIAVDANEFTVNFTDTNSYAGYEAPRYVVVANGVVKGHASANGDGSSKEMVLSALTQNTTFKLKIAAMRYKNLADPMYSQSNFSNEYTATTQSIITPATAYWQKANRFKHMDVVNLPISDFEKAEIVANSPFIDTISLQTQMENGQVRQIYYDTGTYIEDYFVLAPFNAELKVKFRAVNGSSDSLFAGATDYSIKDVKIKLNNPYKILKNIDNKDIEDIYDLNNAPGVNNLSENFQEEIEAQIKRQFLLSFNHIQDKIKKTTITDYSASAGQDRNVTRDLLDLHFANLDLDATFQPKTINYIGNVLLKTKMMIPSNTGEYFDYTVINSSNGKVYAQGRNGGIMLFSDIQDPYISITTLNQASSQADVLGG